MTLDDFPRVSDAALSSIETLLTQWLPNGVREGHEYCVGSRAGEAGRSMKIRLTGEKAGVWRDFSDDEGGADLISLYAYIFGLSLGKACAQLAEQFGIELTPDPEWEKSRQRPAGARAKAASRASVPMLAAPPAPATPVKKRTAWEPMLPVPENAGPYPKAHPVRGRPDSHWEYRNEAGQLLGVVYRFTTSDGGKEVLPSVFARHPDSGAREWRWLSFPEPRPLYLKGPLRAGVTKLFVEGEKCVDAGHGMLPEAFDWISWPGGCKAVGKTDWSQVRDCDVIMWADTDAKQYRDGDEKAGQVKPEHEQPGMQAMRKIADILRGQGCSVSFVDIPEPGAAPDGWDVSDLIQSGATADEVAAWTRKLRALEPALGKDAECRMEANSNLVPSAVASPAPLSGDAGSGGSQADSPHPLQVDAPPAITGLFTLEWALAHCALVQGSTNVWDSLNKLLMKRSAFIDAVGKDNAKVWSAHGERRSISPRNLPRIVRGVAVDEGGRGDDNIVMMLDRYTLLYGTKTVWDAYNKTILGYDAMALARGGDLAERWVTHPLHREVDLDKLVFDPTQRVDLETHINMFEGFPLKPKKDEDAVQLVLQLLYNLCSFESNCDDVFKWVLSWLAYPLQHPGAKMQTALLFFGEKQGTGKSLFFEGIVKPIYGAHGSTGGQHQLEATYTMWRSQKLFVLFEEILSRQDKYTHFGLIKHMITGRDTQISQKFKDDRTEANHLNCVMLSNEFQAVPIEPEDRRFLVVEARMHPDLVLIEKVRTLVNAGTGLSEALYAFLLDYPLGDFNEHTKPLMTPSKERVINFGRPDWEAFYLSWAAGDLSAPYCSCLSDDLYTVYSRYCNKFGFRSMSITKFAELIAQRVTKNRQWVTIGAKQKRLLTVFHVPSEDGESLSKQCEKFRDLADIKEAS